MSSDLLKDIADETRELVLKAAHPKRRTLRVSPEVAALLEALPGPQAPVSASQAYSGTQSSGVSSVEASEGTGADLGALSAVVAQCTRCPLSGLRTQTVFGDGNPHAKLVFVGEAPGEEEDRQGKPFVGRAGQLLTAIIEKGMGLPRSEVYICNVLKCRPPQNRDPRPDEIEQCEGYLIRQLELIRPRAICALGTHAAHTLLRTTESIGRLRGKWHSYHGIPLRATYHPAYLLRNPADKRKTWEDVLEVLKVYKGEEEARINGLTA
jgi:uracil-DNA glycosylase